MEPSVSPNILTDERGGRRSAATPEKLLLMQPETAYALAKLRGTSLGKVLLAVFDEHTEQGPSFASDTGKSKRRCPFAGIGSYRFYGDERVISAVCAELTSAQSRLGGVREALRAMKVDFVRLFSEVLNPYFFSFDGSALAEEPPPKHMDPETREREFVRRSVELSHDGQFSLLLMQPRVRQILAVEDIRGQTTDMARSVIEGPVEGRRRQAHSTLCSIIVTDKIDELLHTDGNLGRLFSAIPAPFQAYAIRVARELLGAQDNSERIRVLRAAHEFLFHAMDNDDVRRQASEFLTNVRKEVDATTTN